MTKIHSDELPKKDVERRNAQRKMAVFEATTS